MISHSKFDIELLIDKLLGLRKQRCNEYLLWNLKMIIYWQKYRCWNYLKV